MYTAYNMPISDGWEVGRIHIYYNDGQGQFPVSHTISGEWPGGRFGFAMTTVDDINRDGYTDLAVSAPYFGEEKQGRVSIFLSTGSRGLSPTPSQHITPSEFGMRMTSFGFSLAGGLDVDNNTYPDLVVGSYLSSTVVLFRSRPVVDLNVTLTLNESEGIDVDEHNLLLADGSKVASFRLSLCMLFTGVALPEHLNVSYTLSSITQTLPRSLFLLPDGNADSLSQILKLSKDTTLCTHHTGYIRNSIRDKLTPITFIVEYEIVSDQDSHDDELAPVLDSEIEPRKELSIPFLYDCNSVICVPDLAILASSDTSEMVVGSSAVIRLLVSISNNGEDAYESVLNFTQPDTFHFVQVIQLTKNKHLITCDKKTGKKDLVCDLGNPMLAYEQIVMQLVFATDDVKGDFSNVSFILEASSAHNDSNASDNKVSVNVNITIHSDLSFEGASESEYLLYDLQDYQEDNATVLDDEPNIFHRFVLSNRGPSNIGRTAVLIHFPHSISDSTSDRNVIELIDAEVEGGDKCEMDKLFSTPASIDDVNIQSPVSPSSPYEHPLSTSSSTQGPSQPSFGRAPARRRKRRTDIGVTNNPTLNDYDYIAFDGDLPAIDCQSGNGCYEITCHLDTVGTRKTSFRDSAAIVVTSRFHIDQFLKLSAELNITASVALVSNAEVIVHGSDYHVQLPENITLTATATTKIVALQQVLVEDGTDLNPYQPTTIPQRSIWMIIGACLMGVVILAGANAILYKMGFFKRQQIGLEKKVSLRKKPDRMSLRQRSVIFED
ncbi:integrin alpha-V [Strongylocentrotus purpuratus]|uniref:Integrin alpha-2 domain-containing protein n=1 Tax=Strongylocentrotus purpuratus TaxID=7668 RepID=A0A7M7NI58_STRPU|nr:integrin alpha-V [Strongylocentrotus purpuratus]